MLFLFPFHTNCLSRSTLYALIDPYDFRSVGQGCHCTHDLITELLVVTQAVNTRIDAKSAIALFTSLLLNEAIGGENRPPSALATLCNPCQRQFK